MADKTVSINEAVGYGNKFVLGVAVYLATIIVVSVAGGVFIILGNGFDDPVRLVFRLIGAFFLLAAFVIGIALTIGVKYKLWVDILIRSQGKGDRTLTPLIVDDPPE